MPKPMICYVDASYDPIMKFAIIGYQIGHNPIKFNKINNTNNTRAEIIGLITLIENLEPNMPHTIYTDCQSILNRIRDKEKLIKNNFLTKRGIELNNADLYRYLFGLLNDNLALVHIRGHIPKNEMDIHNKSFSRLDISVRHKLRAYRCHQKN